MVKKVNKSIEASLQKNTEKSGSWLCHFAIKNELGEMEAVYVQAWSNAGAGKRWIKSLVIEHTNKKSIKMAITMQDGVGKPTLIVGTLDYKVDA
jgi:hypothetical protein